MTRDEQEAIDADRTPVFGAAISTGRVTGATIDRDSAEVISTDSRDLPADAERWQAAAIIRGMSGADADRRVVAAAPDDIFDWIEVNGLFASDEVVDGVRFIPATSAVLSAAWIDGHLDEASIVAVVDIGAAGVETTIVDIDNGRILRRANFGEFGGDVADDVITQHLIGTYGAAELLDDQVIDQLRDDVRVAREWLSEDQMVDLDGPFVNSPVRLRRTMLEDILAPSLHRLTAGIRDELFGRAIDSVVLVGGLAAMPAVVDAVAAGVDAPTVVPGAHARERGAAWIAAQDDAAIEPAMFASGAIPVAGRSSVDTDSFAASTAATTSAAAVDDRRSESSRSDDAGATGWRRVRGAVMVGALAVTACAVLAGAAWGLFDRDSTTTDLEVGDSVTPSLEASVGTSATVQPVASSALEPPTTTVAPEPVVTETMLVPVTTVEVPVVTVTEEPVVTTTRRTLSKEPEPTTTAAVTTTVEPTTTTRRTRDRDRDTTRSSATEPVDPESAGAASEG